MADPLAKDFNASFPSLPSSSPSILGAPPASQSSPPSPFSWKTMLSKQSDKASKFSVSYVPWDDEDIAFSDDDLSEGKKNWEHSLVGYALGKRPFYASLLAAVNRKWKLKGSFELLTLEGDFFLFKFSCTEDYDTVWDNGPCFLNGRPFVFKKWNCDFRPVKEEVSTLPLWVKFPSFPLSCWTESGISRVASHIGIPLAVDHLTATMQRLSFARVCVQITPSSPLPNSLSLVLNGKRITQEVVYDWKPTSCPKCSTFSHGVNTCPLNSSIPPPNRGRSRSRARFARTSVAATSRQTPQNFPPPPPTHPPSPPPPPLAPPPPSNIPPIPHSLGVFSSDGVNSSQKVNDLNQLPIASPPSPPPENLPNATSSFESSDAPLDSTTAAQNAALSVNRALVYSSPGHSYGLRSASLLTGSPPLTINGENVGTSTNTSNAQPRAKKKGKNH